MNPIGEFDFELLEAYLDDALTAAQVQHVSQRLLAEPELAAAMHALRQDRGVRLAMWRSTEPAPDHASAVADRVASAIHKIERRRAMVWWVRIGSAAAAAVAVFVAGWIIRGSSSTSALAESGPSSRAVSIQPDHRNGAFQVVLTDAGGHVVGVQRFIRQEDATQFADDLARYQARRQAVQRGGAVLVSDRF